MVSANNSSNYEDHGLVGKALSEWHAYRMIEHEDIEPVMSKEARKLAVGDVNDFPEDAVCTYMTKYAEKIFEPKRILSSGDWLKRYREPDQRFCYYKQGKGNIKWLSPTKNKVYLFICDNSFTKQQIAQYKMYAEAFFTGVAAVEIIKAGGPIPGQYERGGQKKVPADFLDKEVENRPHFSGK